MKRALIWISLLCPLLGCLEFEKLSFNRDFGSQLQDSSPADLSKDLQDRGSAEADYDLLSSDQGLEQALPCEPTGHSDSNCDGRDDDCDGQIDEEYLSLGCGLGSCLQNSTPSHCLAGVEQACLPGEGEVERCDGQDNDCDGFIDEDWDLSNDPENCGACGETCGDQSCCEGRCYSLDTLERCGRCEHSCGEHADRCEGGECRCGEGDACLRRCEEGSCLCTEDQECGSEQLCCEGRCMETSAEGPCVRCNDSGCSNDRADRCQGRSCRCGEQGECPESTYCEQGVREPLCVGCSSDEHCPEDAVCCEGRCEEISPENCLGCMQGCDPLRSSRCVMRGCLCGEERPCEGARPFCDHQIGGCVECRGDFDCGARQLCVDSQCQDCDPRDNMGCDPHSIEAFCDLNEMICRGCINSEECEFQDANLCSSGRCDFCQDDDDCSGHPTGNLCKEGSCGICTNHDECSSISDGFVCLGWRCTPCSRNRDCANHPSGDICIRGRCRPCIGDEDCVPHPRGNICADGHCVCREDADCSSGTAGPFCLASLHVCVSLEDQKSGPENRSSAP